MRISAWYIVIICFAFQLQSHRASALKWVVNRGCLLKVDGSTNINHFSCTISNYSNPDTIFISKTNTHSLQLTGSIQLEVQRFDCHNPVMTADLRKTLKSKEFPRLTIRFLSLEKYPDTKKNHDITQGYVHIELAGISKRFQVDYRTISSENNVLNLVGTRTINFSDFGITPPRKLGGMIKTNNELNVEFNLKMTVL